MATRWAQAGHTAHGNAAVPHACGLRGAINAVPESDRAWWWVWDSGSAAETALSAQRTAETALSAQRTAETAHGRPDLRCARRTHRTLPVPAPARAWPACTWCEFLLHQSTAQHITPCINMFCL